MTPEAFEVMRLNQQGGGEKITLDEAMMNLVQNNGLIWIRLNYEEPDAREWLEHAGFFDSVVVEGLQDEDSRPRSTLLDGGLLVSLRGVNLNEGKKPNEMIAIMMWFEENLILTARSEKLKSFRDLERDLLIGRGPRTGAQFLSAVIDRLADNTEILLEDLEDKLEEFEWTLDMDESSEIRSELADIRRFAIRLKRYLTPQREALSHLLLEPPKWLKKRDKTLIQENITQYERFLDDLMFISDRSRVAQEELINILSEKMNVRMLTLSLATTIFLPLSFFTGLFGINVGGIPWAHSNVGFWLFCGCSVFFAFFQVVYFKWKKWF